MPQNPRRITELVPDKENSTFYCQTNFADSAQKPMIGYSKMIGYTEPKDKCTCLFNMHFRLWEQGYMRTGKHYNTRGNLINPVAYMAYYRNHTNVPVYFFFPSYAEPQIGFNWPIQFIEKVESFYQDIAAGASLGDLRSRYFVTRVKAVLVQDDLDLSNPRFYSDVSLQGYADSLKKKNFPPQVIQEYVKAYTKKFFINGKMNPDIFEEYRKQQKTSLHAQEVKEEDASAKAYQAKADKLTHQAANKFLSK